MSYSVQPLAYQPLPEEPSAAGLRTSLRNVPMLPAPANVEDLLARLDPNEAPLSSGALAAMISDALAAEQEPVPFDDRWPEDPDFFAPVALAANTNEAPPPRPAALMGRLSRAGLVAGALFLVWPALLAHDPVPQRQAMPAIALPELALTALSPPNDLLPPPPIASLPPVTVDAASDMPDDTLVSATPAVASGPVEESDLAVAIPLDEVPEVPELEVAAGAPEPAAETPAAGDLAAGEEDGVAEPAAVPLPPSRPTGAASAPFAGLWAVSAKACTPAMQEAGSLVADITRDRARAGNTTCTFKGMEQRGNTWTAKAVCSNGRSSWKSDVRLTLKRGLLTWKSQKGAATYVRCQGA